MLTESFKSMCVKMGEGGGGGGGGRLFRITGTCVKKCENIATSIMLTQFKFKHLSALLSLCRFRVVQMNVVRLLGVNVVRK